MTLRHIAGIAVLAILTWGLLAYWVWIAIGIITGSAWQ
jgi:hypothetical protein